MERPNLKRVVKGINNTHVYNSDGELKPISQAINSDNVENVRYNLAELASGIIRDFRLKK